MIWKAKYKDGTIFNEYTSGTEFLFSSIDKTQLDKFMITETGNEMMIHFSADNGITKFNNLDLRKISKLAGGEELTLKYDEEKQQFIMTSESLEFYNSLTLKDETLYNNIEFDQSGKFYLNGEEFWLSLHIGNELVPLINQPPYNEIIHFKKAEVDFIGNKNSRQPYKRVDNTWAYSIGYKKIHRHNNLEINYSITLLYEVQYKTITMFVQIGCNKDLNANLLTHLGKKHFATPFTIYKHLPPMSFERPITQLG